MRFPTIISLVFTSPTMPSKVKHCLKEKRGCLNTSVMLMLLFIGLLYSADVKLPVRSSFVTIDSILGCKGSHQVRTLQLGPSTKVAAEEERVPLVLVHGFASGVALWLLNLDYLAQDRTTYCFDLLGFGRSSRPRLSRDPLEAEYQFVQSKGAAAAKKYIFNCWHRWPLTVLCLWHCAIH